ncbi:MAG: MOMP family protein [Chlamydiia bacterium]|nr:MOMP family protein [Chlamydiia bacterium]
MKVISLLSAAALATALAASGFCEESVHENVNARTSQNSGMLAHDMNGNRSNSYNSSSYSSSSTKMDDGKTVSNSVHGCVNGFSLQAEFLWWRAQIDHLEYAVNNGATPPAAAPFVTSGRVKEPDFSFDPGVRVSAGYDFGKENWDLFLRWTYQDTTASGNTGTTAIPNGVVPLRDFTTNQGTVTVSVADTANATWKNTLNVFDIEMGYDYFLSRRCSLRPFMGIKAAWIDSSYKSRMQNVTFNQQGTIEFVEVNSKSDYWGVGPQVGMEGNLHIGWGFSVYGLTSAALVYGQYESSFSQQESTSGNHFREKNDGYSRQRAMAQIALGLEWAWCFSGDYLLAFNLGWEGQYWWNQHELLFAQEATYNGDLTYTGLSAGMRFDF